jgi:hypothetical protein
MNQICFSQTTFLIYIFIYIFIIIFLSYCNSWSKKEQLTNVDLYGDLNKEELYTQLIQLKNKLYNCKLTNQKYEENLNYVNSQIEKNLNKSNYEAKFLAKMQNPLISPDIVYPNGTLYSNSYDGYKNYQMIGYLTNENGQFPVFGRYKYPGKSDKYEYYTMNEGRNKIKIPFKTKNYNELYTDDTVNVPELGGTLIFKKYDNEQNRYDPNIF